MFYLGLALPKFGCLTNRETNGPAACKLCKARTVDRYTILEVRISRFLITVLGLLVHYLHEGLKARHFEVGVKPI